MRDPIPCAPNLNELPGKCMQTQVHAYTSIILYILNFLSVEGNTDLGKNTSASILQPSSDVKAGFLSYFFGRTL